MKVLKTAAGRSVQIGDVVTSFRGEEATVTGWQEPRHEGSTGRIRVKWLGVDGCTATYDLDYYPSVFNLTWAREA